MQNLSIDCCTGLSIKIPVRIQNRPGLTAVTYRIGDYSRFRDSLLARLSTSGYKSLQSFTTREEDDFTVALIDAWATVAEILTFYQERIANESYLNTATEQLSLVALAGLIGYQLRPGVAAKTVLSFNLDENAGPISLIKPIAQPVNYTGFFTNY